MTIEVTISERPLESMVLAACEAYTFGKDDSQEALETSAHLWSNRRSNPDGIAEHVYVDRISVCVSASVANNQSAVFVDVVALQDDVVKHWSPHISLLGNFHTHPYNSHQELKDNKNRKFSDCDKSSFLYDDVLWQRVDDNRSSWSRR